MMAEFILICGLLCALLLIYIKHVGNEINNTNKNLIATINHINNLFKPYYDIYLDDKLIDKFQCYQVILHNIPEDIQFTTYGFSTTNFSHVINLNTDFSDRGNRSKFRKDIETYIKTLYHNDKVKFTRLFGFDYSFDDILAVDTVLRDTSKSIFKPITLVHTDFHYNFSHNDILNVFGNKWKDINLTKQKIICMRNIWINLTPVITDNGLTLLKKYSSLQQDIVPYTAYRREGNDIRKFISASLLYQSYQKWFTKYNMTFGDAYIFDTYHTPHTSYKIIGGNFLSGYRQSIETRILFMKDI